MMCGDHILTHGRMAAEEILANYFLIDVRKALDPLNPHDFVSIVKSLSATLAGHAVPVESAAIKKAVDALDVDWTHLPKEARWKLIDHVRAQYLDPITTQALPQINQTLSFYAKDIVANTKSKAIKKFDLNISPNLNAFDKRVLTYCEESQGHFITDRNGNRADAFVTHARNIVSFGLDQGLGSSDIAAHLHAKLGPQVEGREARGYWDMIAMVFANRARTMTQLGGFHEAGITDFLFESVMDEVTSVQCRFLHGRRFPVAKAMEHFDQVENADDPGDIKSLTPFINFGMVDGKPSLYTGRQGAEDQVTIAHVTHNAVGTKDHPGTFANGKSNAELLAMGISTPPLHGRCRSTIIPEMGEMEHPAAAPAPPLPPKPPKPKPEAPPPPPLPDAFTDPNALITFGKQPLHEGLPLNGIPLTHAAAPDWKSIADVPIGEPPLPPGQKMSSGCVVVEPDGRIWIYEPKDHFGGYEHTYPKGKIEPGLTSQQNALKELYEEAGLTANIAGHVGDFKGDTGTTRYYVAHRTGGAPWDAHWEADNVKLASMTDAEKLLNKQRDKDVLAALKKHLADNPKLTPVAPEYTPPKAPKKPKKPKPGEAVPSGVSGPHLPVLPVQPQPVTSKPPLSADVILHEKTGGQKGSNDGGFYTGKDGVQRYVKFYKSSSQAAGEHLANTIYKDLGVGAPESNVFEYGGKQAYAGDILKGGQTLREVGLNAARAKSFLKGFVGDVLTGNWDAVGQNLDNAMFIGEDAYRIDNGGAFLMRAQGVPKEKHHLNDIAEWQGFFDPNVNRAYASVAKAAGYASPEDFKKEVVAQIKQVIAVRDTNGGWQKYVDRVTPQLNSTDRAAIVSMLNSRTDKLSGQLAEMTAVRPPPRVPGAGERVLFGMESPAGKKVFSKLDEMQSGYGRAEFYREVYAKAGIKDEDRSTIASTIGQWTGEFRHGSEHAKVNKAATAILDGKGSAQSDIAKALKRTHTKRSNQWRATLDRMGFADVPTPTHFDASRGMTGEDWVLSVARAWANDAKADVKVNSDAVASWGFSEKTGREFAGADRSTGRPGRAGVMYRWHIPIENTLMDQVVDDASFLTSFQHEREIIAGEGTDHVTLPKESHVVFFDYKEYTYDTRKELIEALRRHGHTL